MGSRQARLRPVPGVGLAAGFSVWTFRLRRAFWALQVRLIKDCRVEKQYSPVKLRGLRNGAQGKQGFPSDLGCIKLGPLPLRHPSWTNAVELWIGGWPNEDHVV